MSGTSFSAPHIAGAAALLLQMFPTLTPAQVVQLLLQTATALGAETVFGQGLVNLAAAVLPQGIPEVVLGGASSGFSIPLEQTQLQLGAAFGDALVNNATLKNAIYLDSYNRAYVVDLTQYITPATRSLNLESAIAKNNYHSVELPTPDGMSVRFGYSDDPRTLIASDPDQRTSFNTSIESLGSPSYNMDVSVRVSHNTSAWFGANATSDNVFAKPRAMLGRRLFWSSEEMLTPGSTLIAPGDGFAVNRTLNGSTSVSLGFFRSDGWDDDEIPGGEGSMATATIGRSFHSGIESSAAFGIVEEDQTFLGSDPDGAYGDNGGTTQFAALLASFPIHRSVEAFASATVGLTDVVSGAPNLLEDWSEVYSDAFGVGLVARNVAVERDRLGFLVGQPLRVSDASATLTAPVGQEASGQIIHQSERVDLSPSGREIDFQIAYNRDVWTRAELSAWLMARLEPGHDETAEPDYGLGAKLEIKF